MNNNHFDLTLDTLAPTGSIKLSGDNPAIYENKDLTIEKNDATFMKVWFTNSAEGSKEDSGYVNGQWIEADTKFTTAFTISGDYWYHMVLMDDVGNESEVYNTGRIIFDSEIPVVSNINLPSITASKSDIQYSVEFSDPEPSSGVKQLKVKYSRLDEEGQVVETVLAPIANPVSGQTYTFSFNPDDTDAEYTLTVVAVDTAGNESVPKSAKIILNTAEGTLTLSLLTVAAQSLPDYINYHDIKANIQCLGDISVVGYKVWEEGTDEPEDWTSREAGTELNVTVALTLSANDGKKTINAKAINTAGTIVEAESKSVTIDTVAPTISLTSDRTIISTVSGFDTAKLTISGTDDKSKIKSYKLVRGTSEEDTNITDGTDLSEDIIFDLTKASGNLSDDGTYTLTLFVYDNAENKSTASVEIILDTTSPEVSLNDLTGTSADTAGWYNAVISNAVTTFSDANGISKLYIWVSRSEADETPATGLSPIIDIPASPFSIPATEIQPTWSSAEQGSGNFLHVQVVDAVGNKKTASKEFKFDNIAPSSLTANFGKSVYKSGEDAYITVSAVDATSGTAWMRVTGNISDPTESDTWEVFKEKRNVTFSGQESYNVEVTVQVKDAAGNIRTETATASCEYDPVSPFASLTLRNPADTSDKESPTPVAEFKARVSGTDDSDVGIASFYQLYGDFSFDEQSGQSTSYVDDDAHWVELRYDEGQNYQTVSNLFLNAGEGYKNIYLRVKDNAGNISEPVIQTIKYDVSAPEVVVSDIDYQRISKVHDFRRNGSSVTTDYCDEMHFKFTPNELIKAYKVCAYLDQAAAEAGSPDDPAIPQSGDTVEGLTPKSTNMHQNGGLESDNTVSCMINGADFEYALGHVSDSHEFDGTHIVVVYVQDMSGQWSEAAMFDTSI